MKANKNLEGSQSFLSIDADSLSKRGVTLTLQRLLMSKKKRDIPVRLISMLLLAAIFAAVYLGIAWNRYQRMAESEAKQVAESVGSLLHADHIAALSDDANSPEATLVQESLTNLVEITDSIHYAYILEENGSDIAIVADSDVEIGGLRPTRHSCEAIVDINRQPFSTGESVVSEAISTPCGNWIRALVPLSAAKSDDVVAVLGLSYLASEWNAQLWSKMVLDILIVIFVIMLLLLILHLQQQNRKYRIAERSRLESERSKTVFFSQLPGMGYRCKNNSNWTMEFVSEGCYDLTGYKAENLLDDRDLSYRDIIAPDYRQLISDKWQRVLLHKDEYRDEYEIVTKDGTSKWVMEVGQGVYDCNGEIEALEGIVLDISGRKKKELQITKLKERDFLTNLYNRPYLKKEAIRLDQPEFLPLTVVVCDIDGLSVINDAYGYIEGDYLIRSTAQLIKNCLEDTDVLAHYGGGSFSILMPNTSFEEAVQFESELRSAIDCYNRVQTKALYAISVTIGHSTKYSSTQKMYEVRKKAKEQLTRRKMLNQNSSHSAVVSSIMAALYAKSQETEEHGQRLGQLCLMIGKELGLPQRDLEDLQLLSKLHDIGKIGIDDRILNKPGKLNEEEWIEMKQHPEIGYSIAMTTPQLADIAEYILTHHERWDGKGYPRGLQGEEIPLVSRILSIADAFDAMVSERVYQKAKTVEEALIEIEENAGTQFDPQIAMSFVNLMRRKEKSS